MAGDGGRVFIGLLAFKLLLVPAYYSTDLEVHRHWMAVTSKFPASQWYRVSGAVTGSEWTLDYPPMFARFQQGLAFAAKALVPAQESILDLSLDSSSSECRSLERRKRVENRTVWFMRGTVLIVSDGLFAIAACRCLRVLKSEFTVNAATYLTVLGNGCLLLVDNIHFQYNGLPLAIYLLALEALAGGFYSTFGFLLAAAILLKHTLLYYVPCLAVWVLFRVQLSNWLRMGLSFALTVTALIWPFRGDLASVALRLFPFDRGLMHSYWAPNWWVIWVLMDKVLSILLGRRVQSSSTKGLVGVKSEFGVLPTPTPAICGLLTVSCIIVPVVLFLYRRRPARGPGPLLVELCALSSYAGLISFFWGWHVHEKAILLASVPLTIIAAAPDRLFFAPWVPALLIAASNASVGPLLHEAPELLLRLSIALGHYFVFRIAEGSGSRFLVVDAACVAMCIVSLLPGEGGLFVLFEGLCALEFLPLLLTSAVCAVAVLCIVSSTMINLVVTQERWATRRGVFLAKGAAVS